MLKQALMVLYTHLTVSIYKLEAKIADEVMVHIMQFIQKFMVDMFQTKTMPSISSASLSLILEK